MNALLGLHASPRGLCTSTSLSASHGDATAVADESAFEEALPLAAAIARRWGRTGAEGVLRALALHMICTADPELGRYRITGARAGKALTDGLGADWKEDAGLSGTGALRQLLNSSLAGGCFVVTHHNTEIAIRLDTQALLAGDSSNGSGTDGAAATATSSRGHTAAPARAPAPAAGVPPGLTATVPILAGIKRRWGGKGAASVLRLLATHMVTTPDPQLGQYAITGARAGEVLLKGFGSSWKELAGAAGIQQLLRSSTAGGCFVVGHEPGVDLAIRLNTQALQAGDSSSSSRRSRSIAAADTLLPHTSPSPAAAPDVTATAAGQAAAAAATLAAAPAAGVSEAGTLLAAIRCHWGDTGAASVLRELATHMVTTPDSQLGQYAITGARAGTLLQQSFETSWKELAGVSNIQQLLSSSTAGGYFVVGRDPCCGTDKAIRLDTEALLAGGSSSSSTTMGSSISRGSGSAAPAAVAVQGITIAAAAQAAAAAAVAAGLLPAPGGVSGTGTLLAAIRRRWGDTGADSVLKELATHMVTMPDPQLGQYQLTGARTGSFLGQRFRLGRTWKEVAGVSSIQQLLSSSAAGGCFVVVPHGSEVAVRLDTKALLAQGSNSSSSNGGIGGNTPPSPALVPVPKCPGRGSAGTALPAVTAGAGLAAAAAAGCESSAITEVIPASPQTQLQQASTGHTSSGTPAPGHLQATCEPTNSSSSSGGWQPAWYQQVTRLTPQVCSSMPTVLIDLSKPADEWEGQLARCLAHLSCCSVVGLDCEHAARAAPAGGTAAGPVQQNASGSSSAGASLVPQSGKRDPAGLHVAMLQVLAPTARSKKQWPGYIYLLALPDDQEVTQPVVQQLLGPLLTSQQLVKVMHDPRQDAAVLQQQYGVELQGVLDTQLLAGMVAAAKVTSTAAGGAGNAAAAGSSSSSSSAGGTGLHRVGLGALYQQYGFDHPHKKAVHAMFDQDDRLWYRRPLTAQLLAYAADDVRYLLPVAAALLQQLPAAALGFSSAVLAGYVPPRKSTLSRQHLPGYSSMFSGAEAAAGDVQSAVGLAFELVLDQQHRPSYRVFVAEEEQTAPSSSSESVPPPPAAAAAAAAEVVALLDEAVEDLLDLLPPSLHPALAPYTSSAQQPALAEVVIDHGRPVQLVLSDRTIIKVPQQYSCTIRQALGVLQQAAAVAAAAAAADDPLGDSPGTGADDSGVGSTCSSSDSDTSTSTTAMQPSAGGMHPVTVRQLFSSSNRLSVSGSLHRISAMFTNTGTVSGLTYRVGRHVPGVGRLLLDVLASLKASLTAGGRTESLLMLGRPGTGKTTLLRDIARLLSTSTAEGGLGLRVVVVDTSNEIAGDGPVPHPCIGDARRMMVPTRGDQASIMIEAVQNHCPDVIIVDEIGTRKEAEAAHTIAQRGVILVGTAHGIDLSSLLKNPDLVRLVGGVSAVTLGDAAAAKSNSNKKVRLERAGAAVFTRLVELQGKNRWRYHPSVEHSVDTLLSGGSSSSTNSSADVATVGEEEARQLADAGWRSRAGLLTQLRSVATGGQLMVEFESAAAAASALNAAAAAGGDGASGDGDQSSTYARAAGGRQLAGGAPGGWLVAAGHMALHQLAGLMGGTAADKAMA